MSALQRQLCAKSPVLNIFKVKTLPPDNCPSDPANVEFDQVLPQVGISISACNLSTLGISSWIFQRLIGFCYYCAFISVTTQITGLIGAQGILPISRMVDYLHRSNSDVFTLASFFWFDYSDAFLKAVCWSGVLASVLVMLGVFTPLLLFVCWLLWLTIVNGGQEFFSFQWDVLLLEAGFLAIFLAPLRVCACLPRNKILELTLPPAILVWLLRFLLFKLMFESGLCKLTSGDETWHNLTALHYHFFTQPLPTVVAWFADKLPLVAQKSMTFLTLIIELLVPFFFFFKKLRFPAAVLLILLQLIIAITGNYAFFNILSIGLCLFLIDDEIWSKYFKPIKIIQLNNQTNNQQVHPGSLTLKQPAFAQKTLAILAGSFIAFVALVSGDFFRLPLSGLESTCYKLQRFYFFNHYGLFATMTTTRPEIIIEGSPDGRIWKTYEFRFKPGDLQAPPCLIAPGQPRLDWQMWFAALSPVTHNPWFANLIIRLFQNSPDVIALLKDNPFPNTPPLYLRAKLYRYSFSKWQDLSTTGNWWQREYLGEYLPIVSQNVAKQASVRPSIRSER